LNRIKNNENIPLETKKGIIAMLLKVYKKEKTIGELLQDEKNVALLWISIVDPSAAFASFKAIQTHGEEFLRMVCPALNFNFNLYVLNHKKKKVNMFSITECNENLAIILPKPDENMNYMELTSSCELCQKGILITDEYIRLQDCQHIFHRICLIHKLVKETDKKFFLTP